jgi:hypothetical protein
LLVRREPCAFGLGKAMRGPFGLEAQDRLVVIDGSPCCARLSSAF